MICLPSVSMRATGTRRWLICHVGIWKCIKSITLLDIDNLIPPSFISFPIPSLPPLYPHLASVFRGISVSLITYSIATLPRSSGFKFLPAYLAYSNSAWLFHANPSALIELGGLRTVSLMPNTILATDNNR